MEAQLELELATLRGERQANLATEKVEREEPNFRERAQAAVLARLATGPASGEDLTDYVRACGIDVGTGKGMGGVYQGMRKRGLIKVVGTCQRRRGHGTAGGLMWGRADA